MDNFGRSVSWAHCFCHLCGFFINDAITFLLVDWCVSYLSWNLKPVNCLNRSNFRLNNVNDTVKHVISLLHFHRIQHIKWFSLYCFPKLVALLEAALYLNLFYSTFFGYIFYGICPGALLFLILIKWISGIYFSGIVLQFEVIFYSNITTHFLPEGKRNVWRKTLVIYIFCKKMKRCWCLTLRVSWYQER